MTKVIAAVYGPEASTSKVSPLQRKLSELLVDMGMKPHAVFGHLDVAQIEKEVAEAPFCSLVVGWGLKETPRWSGVFGNGLLDVPCRQLIAIDLYERTRANGVQALSKWFLMDRWFRRSSKLLRWRASGLHRLGRDRRTDSFHRVARPYKREDLVPLGRRFIVGIRVPDL